MNAFDSPFVIPVAAMAVGAVAIVGGIVSSMHSQRMRAEQRMALIARGANAEDIAKLLGNSEDDARPDRRIKDPMRSLANVRRAGIILCSIGVGLIAFFILLVQILGVREVYAAAAAGLIPLAIGIGFFIDYAWQKRDLARFGLEVDPKA